MIIKVAMILPLFTSCLFKQQEQNTNSQNDTFSHADMVTYLCCLTNRTSEPGPGKHAALCMLMQCREPECNERDILMAFHLFMRRKWRGTVTFWNGWQNKEPTLGKWLYLWFHSDRWRDREGDWLTRFWQFKVLNDMMYGNIQYSGTGALALTLYSISSLQESEPDECRPRRQLGKKKKNAVISASRRTTVQL